jgi:hypothetical protein
MSLLLLTPPSNALVITISGVQNNSTPNIFSSTSNKVSEFRTETSILNAGQSASDTTGQSVTASTRMAFVARADSDTNANASVSALLSYRINVFVIVPQGVSYKLKIDRELIGDFSRSEAFSSFGTTELLTGEATFNRTTSMSPMVDVFAPNGGINRFGTDVFSGFSGIGQHRLDFTWSASASSGLDPGSILPNGSSGADVAARFGLAGTSVPFSNAANYPGSGNRNINLDGHFVTITAIVVPEASTMTLIAGAMVVGIMARRRWVT